MAKRRRSGRLHGAAVSAKHAPARCKQQLSSCMTGKGSRQKSSRCMKQFARCRKA
jgi:hypothetical protein